MLKVPSLEMTCRNCRGRGVLTGPDGTMQLCVGCGGSGRQPVPVDRVPFDYAFSTIDTVDTNGNAEQDLQLDDDAAFECVGFTGFGGGIGWTLQLSDQSNGWQFSNTPLQWLNSISENGLLFPLLVPYIWMPSSQALLRVSVLGGSGALAQGAQFVMKGYKLYPKHAAPAATQGRAA